MTSSGLILPIIQNAYKKSIPYKSHEEEEKRELQLAEFLLERHLSEYWYKFLVERMFATYKEEDASNFTQIEAYPELTRLWRVEANPTKDVREYNLCEWLVLFVEKVCVFNFLAGNKGPEIPGYPRFIDTCPVISDKLMKTATVLSNMLVGICVRAQFPTVYTVELKKPLHSTTGKVITKDGHLVINLTLPILDSVTLTNFGDAFKTYFIEELHELEKQRDHFERLIVLCQAIHDVEPDEAKAQAIQLSSHGITLQRAEELFDHMVKAIEEITEHAKQVIQLLKDAQNDDNPGSQVSQIIEYETGVQDYYLKKREYQKGFKQYQLECANAKIEYALKVELLGEFQAAVEQRLVTWFNEGRVVANKRQRVVRGVASSSSLLSSPSSAGAAPTAGALTGLGNPDDPRDDYLAGLVSKEPTMTQQERADATLYKQEEMRKYALHTKAGSMLNTLHADTMAKLMEHMNSQGQHVQDLMDEYARLATDPSKREAREKVRKELRLHRRLLQRMVHAVQHGGDGWDDDDDIFGLDGTDDEDEDGSVDLKALGDLVNMTNKIISTEQDATLKNVMFHAKQDQAAVDNDYRERAFEAKENARKDDLHRAEMEGIMKQTLAIAKLQSDAQEKLLKMTESVSKLRLGPIQTLQDDYKAMNQIAPSFDRYHKSEMVAKFQEHCRLKRNQELHLPMMSLRGFKGEMRSVDIFLSRRVGLGESRAKELYANLIMIRTRTDFEMNHVNKLQSGVNSLEQIRASIIAQFKATNTIYEGIEKIPYQVLEKYQSLETMLKHYVNDVQRKIDALEARKKFIELTLKTMTSEVNRLDVSSPGGKDAIMGQIHQAEHELSTIAPVALMDPLDAFLQKLLNCITLWNRPDVPVQQRLQEMLEVYIADAPPEEAGFDAATSKIVQEPKTFAREADIAVMAGLNAVEKEFIHEVFLLYKLDPLMEWNVTVQNTTEAFDEKLRRYGERVDRDFGPLFVFIPGDLRPGSTAADNNKYRSHEDRTGVFEQRVALLNDYLLAMEQVSKMLKYSQDSISNAFRIWTVALQSVSFAGVAPPGMALELFRVLVYGQNALTYWKIAWKHLKDKVTDIRDRIARDDAADVINADPTIQALFSPGRWAEVQYFDQVIRVNVQGLFGDIHRKQLPQGERFNTAVLDYILDDIGLNAHQLTSDTEYNGISARLEARNLEGYGNRIQQSVFDQLVGPFLRDRQFTDAQIPPPDAMRAKEYVIQGGGGGMRLVCKNGTENLGGGFAIA
jgi:hypothetical protein